MPWSPLIFSTVLFGVIFGNHLIDSRIHRPFAAFKNVAAFNDLNNEFAGNKIRELPPCPQINGLEGDILNEFYGFKECDNSRKDAILYGINSNDYEVTMENTKTKREFLTGSSRNSVKSDMLSDIMGMEVPALKFGDIKNDQISSAMKDVNKGREHQGAAPTFSSTYFIDYAEEKIGNELQTAMDKRTDSEPPATGCDCKIKNDIIDLGLQRFPRFLLNAVCQSKTFVGYSQKCFRGTQCKPLEYNVRVLKPRTIFDRTLKEPAFAWLPDDLRRLWIFETITVAVGCFCSY